MKHKLGIAAFILIVVVTICICALAWWNRPRDPEDKYPEIQNTIAWFDQAQMRAASVACVGTNHAKGAELEKGVKLYAEGRLAHNSLITKLSVSIRGDKGGISQLDLESGMNAARQRLEALENWGRNLTPTAAMPHPDDKCYAAAPEKPNIFDKFPVIKLGELYLEFEGIVAKNIQQKKKELSTSLEECEWGEWEPSIEPDEPERVPLFKRILGRKWRGRD